MTTHFQPGHHPDADQLNAFVEHALPLHEQQATLAHLATCADCRATVYLAQSAIPEAFAHPQPAPAHRPLFSRWMIAFPAAAALACLIFLTIHFRDTAIPTNPVAAVDPRLLKPTPPPPPLAPPAKPAVPPTTAGAQTKTPPAKAVLTPRTEGAPPTASEAPPHIRLGVAAQPKPEISTANAPQDKKKDVPGAMSDTGYLSTATGSAAGSLAGPLTPAASPQTPLIAGAAARANEPHRELRSAATQYDMSHAQAQQAPMPPPPTGSNSGIYGGTGQTNLNQNYIEGVPAASPAAQTVTVTTATDAVAATTPSAKSLTTLPSHLPALSVISNARRQLAIDTAGNLFRSEDAGVTWRPIPVQWTGQAIKVALLPSANARLLSKSVGALSTPTAAAAKSSSAPPAIFELTTDAGDRWISTDGLVWKRK